jgi:cytochrome P450
MLILKDTTLFILTWALHYTASIYSDLESFNPGRHTHYEKLANDYAGSVDYASRDYYNYGARRRICPGIHFIEHNMWRIASKLLWAFEFFELVDSIIGKVKHLDLNANNLGILMAPLPFEV